ncbi:MAG: hypothetical protein OEU50_05515 [Gammaproteobacteria bacterium]|nr:hypothetical protein [Gammaproteobacteria bacterium]
MTEHSKQKQQERRASGVSDRRGRSRVDPQPLDSATRELVREIVDNRPAANQAPKSFIQKILKAD